MNRALGYHPPEGMYFHAVALFLLEFDICLIRQTKT